MLYIPYPFNATFLFCAFFSPALYLLVHPWILFHSDNNDSLSNNNPSLLCTIYISLLCILCMQYSPFLCMLIPSQSLPPLECSGWSSSYLFIFTGSFPTCSTSLDVMLRFLSLSGSWDSSSSLWQSSSPSLFQLQASMPIQLSIPSKNSLPSLEEAWRLFISSNDHTEVSSNSLADVINGFWQFHCVVHQ